MTWWDQARGRAATLLRASQAPFVTSPAGRARRILAGGTALCVVVGAVVIMVVTGTREPAAALRLLTGDAWLSNRATGTVSHVQGYSGKVDAQAQVGAPGDPFEVVQRGDGAYVVDERTGKVSRVDGSSLSLTASIAAGSGDASAVQVVSDTAGTWVLDRSSGVLQQVNATTLAPIGPQIPLGSTTGSATIDTSGSVWVPIPSRAEIEEVTLAGTVRAHPVGHHGDQVQVVTTSTGVWDVNTTNGRAGSLSVPATPTVSLPPTPAGEPATPLVGAAPDDPYLVVLDGAKLASVDTSKPSLSSLTVTPPSGTTQVAVAGPRAYLLNQTADQLETVNLNPMAQLQPVALPRGANQLISKDQLVFVNSDQTPQALVVTTTGQVTDVSKYMPTAPPQAGSTHRGARRPAAPQVTAPAVPFVAPTTLSPPTTVPPTTLPPPITPPPITVGPRPGPGSGTVAPTTTTTVPRAPTTTAPPTVPGVPIITSVTPGDGVVTVQWSPPTSDGGSAIIGYRIDASPSNATQTVPASTTRVSFANQTDGVKACVQVQAVNRVGAGALSPAGQSCTIPQKDSPGTASGVHAQASGVGQITVSWGAASLGPYHTPLKSYTVWDGKQIVATVPGTATTATVSKLANGTTYGFTVEATNTTGNNGPASATAKAATWSSPNRVPGLSVTAGDQILSIKFGSASVPAGSPRITGYTLTVGGNRRSAQPNSTVTVSVPAWTTESVSVVAANQVGDGTPATGGGMAWARTTPRLCEDTASGDMAVEPNCNTGFVAWVDHGSSTFDWIAYPTPAGGKPAATNEFLCTSYYSSTVSGDWYAVVAAPSACPSTLPTETNPQHSQAHAVAYASSSKIDSASQSVCIYRGQTNGTGGSFTSYELFVQGTEPSGWTATTPTVPGSNAKIPGPDCFWT